MRCAGLVWGWRVAAWVAIGEGAETGIREGGEEGGVVHGGVPCARDEDDDGLGREGWHGGACCVLRAACSERGEWIEIESDDVADVEKLSIIALIRKAVFGDGACKISVN